MIPYSTSRGQQRLPDWGGRGDPFPVQGEKPTLMDFRAAFSSVEVIEFSPRRSVSRCRGPREGHAVSQAPSLVYCLARPGGYGWFRHLDLWNVSCQWESKC